MGAFESSLQEIQADVPYAAVGGIAGGALTNSYVLGKEALAMPVGGGEWASVIVGAAVGAVVVVKVKQMIKNS